MQERIQSIKELLNKGLGVAEIASLMNLSKNTVSAYIYHLIWDQAQESLLAKNKASVVRPNEYGGETWDYDMHDFQEEKAEINKNLGFPVGVLRATAFHRDHLKECDRCSLLLKGMNQLKRKQARKIS